MEETVGHLRTRRNSLFARTVLWLTALVCAAFLLGTFAQAWSNSLLIQKVQTAQRSLQKVQNEHQKLEQQAQHYKDPTVIASEARQQMGYARPDEQSVIVVNEDTKQQTQASPNKNGIQSQNYWQDWWHIFFG
jgi:cell division protein FtsL